MLIKLFLLSVSGAGLFCGSSLGMGTGGWLAARRYPALWSAQISVRSPHQGTYKVFCYQPPRDQYLASFLKEEVESFLCDHPHQLWNTVESTGGSQGLTQMCHGPPKMGSSLIPRKPEIYRMHHLEVPPKERLFQSQHSVPPVFLAFSAQNVMDEILALPVEANWLKPDEDFEVSMKNMYLMAYPSTVTMAWYIRPCLWLVSTTSCTR